MLIGSTTRTTSRQLAIDDNCGKASDAQRVGATCNIRLLHVSDMYLMV
jgi:hypothetical protein